MKTFYNKKMTSSAVSLLLVTSSVISANALEIQEEGSIDNADFSGSERRNYVVETASVSSKYYRVTTDSLNLRKGPGTSYSIAGQVGNGDLVIVNQISNGWARITYGGSSSIYCSSKYLTRVDEVAKLKESVYLRKSYSWESSTIALLKNGETVEVIAIGDYWAKLRYKGNVGYVAKKYLNVIDSTGGTTSGSTSSNTGSVNTSTSGTVQITEATYLREKESWSSNKLVLLEKNVKADLISKGAVWSKLKYNGKTGYVSNDYFKIVSTGGTTSGSTSSNTSTNTAKENATITEATYLREKEGWSSNKLVLLEKNVKVEAISKGKDWTKVKYDGKTGYVSNDFIKVDVSIPTDSNQGSTETTTKYVVNTSSLNVRSGAGTSYNKIGSVKEGQVVEVYSISNGWAKIKFNSGVGYVSASYIDKQGSTSGSIASNGKILIYLDAGHGGKDPGAIGTTYSTKEKDAVLDVSKRVASKLKEKGYTVKYSRDTDVYVPLLERTNVANNLGANLFVSFHFNSATTSAAAGIETLYKVDGRDSNVLADKIQNEMINAINMKNRGLKTRSDLSVLNNSKMPAVLIEGGFLSNSSDENAIKSSSFRETLANSVVKGIEGYLKLKK